MPFEVDAGGDTIAVDAWLSLSDHPKSNLVKWAKQLFGDREFDTDEFAGSAARCSSRRARTRKAPPRTSSASSGLRRRAGRPKQDEDIGIDESDFEDVPL